MEDDTDDKITPEMVKGYNDGYLIQKHSPERMDEIMKYINSRPDLERNWYTEAFKAGAKEADKERFREAFTAKKERRKGR